MAVAGGSMDCVAGFAGCHQTAAAAAETAVAADVPPELVLVG